MIENDEIILFMSKMNVRNPAEDLKAKVEAIRSLDKAFYPYEPEKFKDSLVPCKVESVSLPGPGASYRVCFGDGYYIAQYRWTTVGYLWIAFNDIGVIVKHLFSRTPEYPEADFVHFIRGLLREEMPNILARKEKESRLKRLSAMNAVRVDSANARRTARRMRTMA